MCDLCDLVKGNIITRLYYKDDVCIVVDCVTCNTPMIVLSRHSVVPTIAELKHMVEILCNLFGDKATLRIEQRRIRDHLHFHMCSFVRGGADDLEVESDHNYIANGIVSHNYSIM